MKKIIFFLFLVVGLVRADIIRDNAKEVVLDSDTNLMWQDDSDAKNLTKSWSDAIKYCEDLTLGGYDDWYLPNINQLISLVDRTKADPSIKSAFLNITSFYYWSSTTYKDHTNLAWRVYFLYGQSDWYDKGYAHYVRCVRDKK